MSTLQLVEALFDYRVDLILWTVASIGLYGLATNLTSLVRATSSDRLRRPIETFWRQPYAAWCLESVRFLYYLAIPYLALTQGVTSTTLMGMWSADWLGERWFEQSALGVMLGIGALILVVWAWRIYAQSTNEIRHSGRDKPFLTAVTTLRTPWGWGLILLEVLYLEIHWAFYRGAAIRLFGDYYGVFFGLLLIFGEWWLSPDLRREQGAAHRRGETLTTAAMALTIAVIYYFTSNLWLCIGVHLGIQFGLLFFLATYCYDLADYEGQYQ